MRNYMLTWQQAAWLTLALAVVALGLSLLPGRGRRVFAPIAREAAIIAALYTLWQYAGRLSVLGTQGALSRARWIERTERALHLPSERDLQVLTSTSVTAHIANLYYASMHFTALFLFLVWLFLRHRDQYREVRRVLAVATFLCLVVQLVPVAPPRMLPGFTDTALVYGESVYAAGLSADQLAAMPSVHVAWAVLIGVVVWRLAAGPGRLLGPLHAVLTVLVVVSTANHWWADGIVAVALLGLAWLLVRAAERVAGRTIDHWRDRRPYRAAPLAGILPSTAGSDGPGRGERT